jgi:hypothetical protein
VDALNVWILKGANTKESVVSMGYLPREENILKVAKVLSHKEGIPFETNQERFILDAELLLHLHYQIRLEDAGVA